MSEMLYDHYNIRVSRHCGPVRDDGGNRVRYVITTNQGQVRLDAHQARVLAGALAEAFSYTLVASSKSGGAP